MRAVCGALITFGALVCLGLVAVGHGGRYRDFDYKDADGQPQWVRYRDTDTALAVGLAFSLGLLVIGLGITFVGLAHHHRRRNEEFVREYGYLPTTPVFGAPSRRFQVPPSGPPNAG